MSNKMRQEIENLACLREEIKQMGGEEAVKKHHGRGKLTARKRLDLLVEKRTFVETGMLGSEFGVDELVPADGVITGYDYLAANQRIIEELIKYAKETTRNGEPFANDPLIRNELAQLAVGNEVARMMAYRIAWMFSKGLHPSYESSMSMVFISEVMRHTADAGMRILERHGELGRDSKWAVMNARIMRMCLSSLSIGVGGGSNEIQRDIIAMRGLGLPRK